MSDNNKAIVRRFEEAFAANDTATIDELCDPNLVDHNPVPEQAPGVAGFKDTVAMYVQTFSPEIDLQEIISDGDIVATRWTVTGTHGEDFFGVPATGKRVQIEGMNFYRLANGQITDVWTQFDGLGLMEQLGAIPADA